MACNSKSNNRWHWLLWHNHFKNLMIRWKIHKWTVLYSLDEAKNSYFCQNSSKISMTNIQRTIKILLFSTPFVMYWQINLHITIVVVFCHSCCLTKVSLEKISSVTHLFQQQEVELWPQWLHIWVFVTILDKI